MNLRVLDTNFKDVVVLDSYTSLIWTDRYWKYGDFEIYTPMSLELTEQIKQDYYLVNPDSEHVMIVESLKITSDAEDGNYLTVTGRSLESILLRRIIWIQTTVSGNLQNAIKKLLDDAVISPTDDKRKISNFIFEVSDDPEITGLTIEAQYTGDNLYDIVSKICSDKNIGFKITLNSSNQFVFKLYAGADRSYQQTANPYVVFSPKFENVVTCNYMESRTALKNVALIGGEGEGAARKYAVIEGDETGLDRRELFTDARDISSDVADGQTISDEEYYAQLKQRGREDLTENIEVVSFEGEMETSVMFRYGVDFFTGDIVQIADEYGHEGIARVTELVMSEDVSGKTAYPTFETVESSTTE